MLFRDHGLTNSHLSRAMAKGLGRLAVAPSEHKSYGRLVSYGAAGRLNEHDAHLAKIEAEKMKWRAELEAERDRVNLELKASIITQSHWFTTSQFHFWLAFQRVNF